MDNTSSTVKIAPEKARKFVEEHLEGDRLSHTIGVVDVGGLLVEAYPKLPNNPVISSCYLHDVARQKIPEVQKKFAVQFKDLDPIEESIPGLWHAPAGAQMIINHWNLDRDRPLPQAVAFHSTGKSPMEPLLQSLIIADFSEPGREFPEARSIREQIGEIPLNSLACRVLRHKIHYALSKQTPIHTRSVEAYNELCD